MRVSMVDALTAVGYEVEEASTGSEGLERLQTFRNLIWSLLICGCPEQTDCKLSRNAKRNAPIPK